MLIKRVWFYGRLGWTPLARSTPHSYSHQFARDYFRRKGVAVCTEYTALGRLYRRLYSKFRR